MVNVDSIAESIPEMDDLSESQEAAITALIQSIRDHYKENLPAFFLRESTEDDVRRLAYKFLKARRWKPKDSLQMFIDTAAFREANKIDEWLLFPCAFPLRGYSEEDILCVMKEIPGSPRGERSPGPWDACYRALQSSYVNLYHYCDREGHPVLYDCCGGANVGDILRRLGQITPVGKHMRDVVVPYHTYMNEVQYYMIRYANAVSQAAGKRAIMGITVVINAEGMHLGMLRANCISVVRSIFEVDQKYYPEVLHRLFVVNCPSILQSGYRLVKNSLDANTQRKVVFCSKSESLDVLRRVIDENKIPESLGGTCRCEGGCLPRYADASTLASSSGIPSDSADNAEEGLTEDIHVGAGKKFSKHIELDVEEEVSWEFAVHHADIKFTVEFSEGTTWSASAERSPASGAPSDAATTDADPSHSPSVADDSASPRNSARKASHSASHAEERDPPRTAEKKNKSSHVQKSKGFKKNKGQSPAQTLIKHEKLSSDADTFQATQRGTLHLTWDNGYSWVHGKSIQVRVMKL